MNLLKQFFNMEGKNTKKEKDLLLINVIGVSASGVLDLSSEQQKLILSARKISGPKRILDDFQEWFYVQRPNNPLPEFFPSDKPSELIKWLKKQNEKTILFASGDPLWFGIGRVLLEHFSSSQIVFHPSPTSLQLAFSRIGRPWQDARCISLHGREVKPLINLLQKRPNAIGILTDPGRGGAKEVREILKATKLEEQYIFWVFENLGHKKERFFKLSPSQDLPKLDPLHLAILIRQKAVPEPSNDLPIFGIEDNFFLHHEDRPGLLTKREVRIQILADLELPDNGVIWDIGAGVGSIGLEALRIRPKLKLLSIEKRLGGKELIIANAKRLSVKPAKVIEGEAMEILKKGEFDQTISKPKRVILGGGNSDKAKILREILNYLSPKGIVVIPLARLEQLELVINILRQEGCDLKVSQHINFRGMPLLDGTRLHPMNPVFIVKGKLE